MIDGNTTTRARRKRFLTVLILAVVAVIGLLGDSLLQHGATNDASGNTTLPASSNSPTAQALQKLQVKGRAPKTGYEREQFSNGWANTLTCDVRNEMLQRDLEAETLGPDGCKVLTGTLHDPYTGKAIQFTRGPQTSDDVQIDHVVALSDAWQKGAQQLTSEQRYSFANDPLNLLAVDGPINQKKGDSDAASWLPPNKAYRCEYVARQVAVKQKYNLWVTAAEFKAMDDVLKACPDQRLPE